METNLLDRMLDNYLANRSLVTVTLQNKVRVTGKLKAFDSYVIIVSAGKREDIVYRHAVSCIGPFVPEEQRKPAPAVAAKTAPSPAPVAAPRPAPERPKHAPAAAKSAPAPVEPSLNNSMKAGLLKWMQEQKAAK